MSSYRIKNESKWGNPPSNYIPGLGRGAVGFLTRSDIGNARNIDNNIISNKKNEEDDDENNYDKWNGNENGLLSNDQNDQDEEDAEAEQVYSKIDNYINYKKTKKLEIKSKELQEAQNKNNISIRSHFADLKQNLTSLTKDDWNDIPEVEVNIKKIKNERYSIVPDQIIMGGLNNDVLLTSINPKNYSTSGGSTTINNLNDLSQAKNSILSVTIDNLSNDLSLINKIGSSSINQLGYLTELNGLNKNNTEITNFNKAKKIFNSIIETDMMNASAYISLARIEENNGDLKKAREVIIKAVEKINDNEDLWIEASRLNRYEVSIILLKKGLSYIPDSSKLWIAYANRIKDKSERIKIYEQALNYVSGNEKIWKSLISLADDDDIAKVYLSKAVECVPTSIDLWLAYAKIENYENAREILNNARKLNPSNISIWITALRLEETNFILNNTDKSEQVAHLTQILSKCHKALVKSGFTPTRETYVLQAQTAENSDCINTAECIIREAVLRDRDNTELLEIWNFYIEKCTLSKNIICVRTIYETLLDINQSNLSLLLNYLKYEESIKCIESQDKIYQRAIKIHGNLENIWILYSNFLYHKMKNTHKAINILNEGASKLPLSIKILDLLSEFYIIDNNHNEAKLIIINYVSKHSKIYSEISEFYYCFDIHEKIETDENIININPDLNQAFAVLIRLEMLTFDYNRALKLIDKIINYNIDNSYISKNSKFTKDDSLVNIFILKSQCILENKNLKEFTMHAIANYLKAIDYINNSEILYIQASKLLVEANNTSKARTLLETGKINCESCENIHVELVKLEIKVKNYKIASNLLSKSLMLFPKNEKLLSLLFSLEPIHQKESKAADILKISDNNYLMMIEYAKFKFIIGKDINKAVAFLQSAVKINPDYADSWIYLYLLLNKIENKEDILTFEEECDAANPSVGDIWLGYKSKVINWDKTPREILKLALEDEILIWKGNS